MECPALVGRGGPGGGDGYVPGPAGDFSEQETVTSQCPGLSSVAKPPGGAQVAPGTGAAQSTGLPPVILTLVVLLGVVLAGGTGGGIYAVSYYQRHLGDIQAARQPQKPAEQHDL